jgi:hypothetical protein
MHRHDHRLEVARLPLLVVASAQTVLELAVGATAVGLTAGLATQATPPNQPARVGVQRVARAVGRLIADRRRLKHVPTMGQIKAMAWFDGREPVSYLLDRAQNFVPEPLDFVYEHELGSPGLCFTVRDRDGYVVTEMVAMRDGGMFDLIASACW